MAEAMREESYRFLYGHGRSKHLTAGRLDASGVEVSLCGVFGGYTEEPTRPLCRHCAKIAGLDLEDDTRDAELATLEREVKQLRWELAHTDELLEQEREKTAALQFQIERLEVDLRLLKANRDDVLRQYEQLRGTVAAANEDHGG